MTRSQLEHVVRAAGAITDEQKILVLGSQSILGAFPQAPESLTVSREADVCPVQDPAKADLISGTIGEISQFDTTFGYYAHGLPPNACPLPHGWETRLVPFQNSNTRGVTALCLAPLDLASSKLVAGRDKDKEFVAEMLRHKLIEEQALRERVALFTQAEQRRIARLNLEIVQARLATAVKEAERAEAAKREAAAKISPAAPPRPASHGPRMGM
ncbi:MAG: hypothetical protein HZA93_12885 [Verrucomicrobia bacterium]|nr:hypothetical protein [Verrucomicrobiota bacterium]